MYIFLIILKVEQLIHYYDTKNPTLRLDRPTSKIIFLSLAEFPSPYGSPFHMAELQLSEENYYDHLHSLTSYQVF